MRRRHSLALLVLAGCNAVFGLEPAVPWDAPTDDGRLPPDRDRDGIVDREDSCIASIADEKSDVEGDGNPADTDGCPNDFESADTDADNIYDECDPLWTLGNDRRRCFMSFANPTITRELWMPRGDASAWDLLSFSGVSASKTGTLVALESFEGPMTTSYDVPIAAMFATGSQQAITLWLRTNEVAMSSDVGCDARGNSTMTVLTLSGSQPPVTRMLPYGVTTIVRMQAVISAGAAPDTRNVRCTVKFSARGFEAFDVAGEVLLMPGRFAFAAENLSVYFVSLLILERDDVPPL